MKLLLFTIALLSGSVFAQTTAVTKNSNNNQITGNLVFGNSKTLEFRPDSFLNVLGTLRTGGSGESTGKVQINNFGYTFNNVDAMLTVQGRNNHAILARSSLTTDGIALAAWSSSGAAAVKAKQDTYFTSPALTVWRNLSLGSSSFDATPAVLVAASEGSATTQKAVEVQASGTSNFNITWAGFATSRDKPLMRFHGRLSTAPSGTYGTDFSAGDLYFNTTDNKFYCHDGSSWKPM